MPATRGASPPTSTSPSPITTTGEAVLDALDGGEVYDVAFRIEDREATRGRLEVTTPLGQPDVAARVELTHRPLWLTCEVRPPITLPVHGAYEFTPPELPVPALEEAVAEKLAAWRRRRKMRDLYDLHWLAGHPLDEPLVRRLTVLKVWHDVVDDVVDGPFDPHEAVGELDSNALPSEEIGLLTQPVEPERWAQTLTQRYQFLSDLDDDDQLVARCDPRDRVRAEKLIDALP